MTIDRMARRRLRGKWKSAIAAQLLWGAAALTGLLTEWGVGYWLGASARIWAVVVLLAVDLLALSPLRYAVAAFHWRSIYRREITLLDCLREGYGVQYGRAVGWRWRYWMRSAGMALCCFFLPALLVGGIDIVDAYAAAVSPGIAVFYRLLTVLSFPLGWAAYRVSMLAYLPSVYLTVSGMEPGQVFAWSRKLMRGSGDRTVCFFLGFGWWMLLYLLILPWPFVSPMLESAKAGLCHHRLSSVKKSGIRHTDA